MTASKKPINSWRKVATAERELVRRLTKLGFPAERGQQKRRGADSPNVICPSLKGFHLEVKITKTRRINAPATLAEWEAQAIRDCEGRRAPLVVHRWNGCVTWWVCVLLPGRRPYWQTLPNFLAEVQL